MISINAKKMAPVLRQIVENEGIHGSLEGIYDHIGSGMSLYDSMKADFPQPLTFVLL